jgi:hypothetical protein
VKILKGASTIEIYATRATSFDSRPSTPLEIPLLSVSGEDTGGSLKKEIN